MSLKHIFLKRVDHHLNENNNCLTMTPWFTKINKYNYNGEPCYLWYNGIQHHQLYDVCHKNKTVNYDDAPSRYKVSYNNNAWYIMTYKKH